MGARAGPENQEGPALVREIVAELRSPRHRASKAGSPASVRQSAEFRSAHPSIQETQAAMYHRGSSRGWHERRNGLAELTKNKLKDPVRWYHGQDSN